MTLPNSQDGLSPNVDLAFAVSGTGGSVPGASGASGASGFIADIGLVSIPGQANLDQTTVEGILRTRMSNSTGWKFASDTAFEGLLGDFGLPLITRIILTAIHSIFGIDLSGIDLSGLFEFLEPLRTILNTVLEFFNWLFNELFGGLVEEVVKPLLEFAEYVWVQLFDGVDDLLKPIFDFIAYVWNALGALVQSLLEPGIDFIKWIWENFVTPILASVTNSLGSLPDLLDAVFKPLLNTIKAFITDLGVPVLTNMFGLFYNILDIISVESLDEFVTDIQQAFTGLLNPQGFVDLLKRLFTWLQEVWSSMGLGLGDYFYKFTETVAGVLPDTPQEVIDNLSDLAARIPILGGLVSAITGKTPVDGVSLDLSTLGSWGREIERQVNDGLDAVNRAMQALQGGISISLLNIFDQNLLSQGDFLTSSTISGDSDWSWDGTVRFGTTGGSAKVVCSGTGTTKYLYSTQSIKVAPGDRLNLSAVVQTSGYTAGTIAIGLIPWVGTSRYAPAGSPVTQPMGSRSSASAGAFTGIPASGATTWTVPTGSNITSVQVVLSAACNSGCTVWFDNLNLSKSGLLGQNLVDTLVGVLRGVVDGLTGAAKGTSDFASATLDLLFNASSGTRQLAFTADGNATGALGRGQDIIDYIVRTVGAAASAPPGQAVGMVFTAMGQLMSLMFGSQTRPGGASTLWQSAIPGLPGTILTEGTVSPDRLNLPAIGQAINPTAGSGAIIVRNGSQPVAVQNARAIIPQNFFTDQTVGTTDISVLAGRTGFSVNLPGWYMVEISYKVNAVASWGWNIAPVLYRNGVAYKMGTDVMYTWGGVPIPASSGANRFVQNSFIVYLTAGGTVQAGYDCRMGLNFGDTNVLGGESGVGTSSTETYMSISLLNRSYN